MSYWPSLCISNVCHLHNFAIVGDVATVMIVLRKNRASNLVEIRRQEVATVAQQCPAGNPTNLIQELSAKLATSTVLRAALDNLQMDEGAIEFLLESHFNEDNVQTREAALESIASNALPEILQREMVSC